MKDLKFSLGQKEDVVYEIAKKIIAIPDNSPDHAADHKLFETHQILKNAMRMAERNTRSELLALLKEAKEVLEGLFRPVKGPSDFLDAQDKCKQTLESINKLLNE